jgi:hypothetical protein
MFVGILLLSGCVGVVIRTEATKTYTTPFSNIKDAQLDLDILKTREGLVTKAMFFQMWGEPSRKTSVDGVETWTYDRGKRWCGMVIMVLLPLPLELPVCTDEEEIVFHEDKIVSVTRSQLVEHGFICGPFIGLDDNYSMTFLPKDMRCD